MHYMSNVCKVKLYHKSSTPWMDHVVLESINKSLCNDITASLMHSLQFVCVCVYVMICV